MSDGHCTDATERTTAFVATVDFDEDTELEDTERIANALESSGYDTRIKGDNSGYLVMRERDVHTGADR